MKITDVNVGLAGGKLRIGIVAEFDSNTELDGSEIATLTNMLMEAAEASNGKTPEPAKAEPEPDAPVSRRGRRAAEPAAEEAAPARRGRGRPAAAPAAEPEPAPEPARRRRVAAEPEASARITDADLVKAASEAARVLTPKVVTEILTEDFKVTATSLIPQDERQEFLDLLDENVAAAQAA